MLRSADQTPMTRRHWCSQSEAAHRMGVTPDTVARLIAAGAIRAEWVRGEVCLEVAEVERYALRRRRCGMR
ncbi:MAG: excisionase family DNA-binding protein [Microthrixaceae bacterium]